MAIVYYNNFVARNGLKYRIDIARTSNRYAKEEIDMPANPLSLSMDDDNDPFLPVRTTTGYVRMFSHAYESIISTTGFNSKVSVWRILDDQDPDKNVRIWAGYIQPKAYSVNTWEADSDAVELAVECPLAAFERMDLPIESLPEYATFGQILKAIIDAQESAGGLGYWDSIMMPSVEEADKVLTLSVDMSLYYDYDEEGNKIANATCLEFIEDFCKFFGYCCRTDGTGQLSFTRTWKNAVNMAYCDDLNCLTDANPGQMFSEQSLNSINFSGDIFASTDNSVLYEPGFRRMTVAVDISKDTTNLYTMPNDRIKDMLKGGAETFGHNTEYDTRDYSIYRSSETSYTYKGWRMNFTTPELYNSNISVLYRGSRLFLNSNFTYYNSPSIGWNPVIEIANTTTSSPQFTLVSLRKFNLAHGYLVINATTYVRTDFTKWTGTGYLRCILKFGRYYWTDNGWSQTAGTFDMSLGSAEGHAGTDTANATGVITNNLAHTDSRINYSGGYGITFRVGTEDLPPICDTITFQICGYNGEKHGRPSYEICIEDLKIDFLPLNANNQKYEDVSEDYVSNNDSHFREKKEISVKFASDKYGMIAPNRLYLPDGSMLTTLDHVDGGVMRPEAWLALKGAEFGATNHRLLDVEVLPEKTGWCDPNTTFTTTASGISGRWFCLAVSYDYYNSTQRLKLIQI